MAFPHPTLERPIASAPTLRRLTRMLDDLVASETDARVVAARVGLLLRAALADPELLERRHRQPAEDRYRQHLVHVHPAGLYSVVALVWKPGQATPIHDHRCWCVVGVWQGIERETTYDLHDQGGDLRLVQRSAAMSRPGDVSVLVPPEEDIHRVENAGDELAISLHVYGADISVHGSSINRTFEDGLVTAAPVGRPPASWRALDTAA